MSSELHAALSDELIRHTKLLHRAKAEFFRDCPAGLDPAAVSLLAAITCNPHLRQRDVAEHMLLDTSTVSRYLTQLDEHHLIERTRNPDDARTVNITATAAGHELANSIRSRRLSAFAELMSDWTEAELTTLLSMLHKLNSSLEKSLTT